MSLGLGSLFPEACVFLSFCIFSYYRGFSGGSDSKESPCNAGDMSSIPGSGRSLEEGNGSPLQYSCLENSMDKGAWPATVHGFTKSQTWLSDFTFSLSLEKYIIFPVFLVYPVSSSLYTFIGTSFTYANIKKRASSHLFKLQWERLYIQRWWCPHITFPQPPVPGMHAC